MDLLVELRLLVYEFLARTIKQTPIILAATTNNPEPQVELILITKHVPTAILATYREVHAEANTIVRYIIKHFILRYPPKIIYTSGSIHELGKLFRTISAEMTKNQVS